MNSFLLFWVRAGRKYSKIREDERLREKSVRLGIRSIVQSIACAALMVLSIWLLTTCLGNLQGSDNSFILNIAGVIIGAGCAVALLIQGMVGSLIYLVYQFKLNRRPVRWIGLAIWIAALVAVIVIAVLLFAAL